MYEERGHRLRLFVELDRNTCPLGDIADQLARYRARLYDPPADRPLRR